MSGPIGVVGAGTMGAGIALLMAKRGIWTRLKDLKPEFVSVYIAGRQGAVAVIRARRSFELLAVNRLDDAFSASPAVAGDALYLRGDRGMYCLAEKARE